MSIDETYIDAQTLRKGLEGEVAAIPRIIIRNIIVWISPNYKPAHSP